MRAGLARRLAERRMTQSVAVWRSPAAASGKTGAPTLHTAAVPMHIFTPSGQASLQALTELGGARAAAWGEAAYNADITEGDELRVGSKRYKVERAVVRNDLTLCALSELSGAAIPPSPPSHILLDSDATAIEDAP
jgi:hypothetical protein